IALPTHGSAPRIAGVAVGIGCAVLGAVIVVARRRAVRLQAPAWIPVAIVLAVVVVAGFGVGRTYVRNRYTHLRGYEWARPVHDTRIAILNLLPQYQLYGGDLSNHVQYVANRGDHGQSTSIATCGAWVRALRDGRYAVAVVTTPDFAYP